MAALSPRDGTGTKVQFSISCKDLPSKDALSKSDPFVVVDAQRDGKAWINIGRTETLQNNPNPTFDKILDMDYYFEEEQLVRFSVYDSDGKSEDLSKHDFIGDICLPLGELLGASRGMLRRGLKNNKGKFIGDASIIVRADEIKGFEDTIKVAFGGRNLDKKDVLGKSDPFYELFRCYKDGTQRKIFTSEVVKKDLNPNWLPTVFKIGDLCAGDYKKKFLVKVYDWDAVGDAELIGTCELSVADFEKKTNFSVDLISEKKKKAGEFVVVSHVISKKASFLDYVVGGCQMKLTIAVDFTGSNGNPREPGTLHHISADGKMNPYQLALQKVGNIILPYADDTATLYGFGGKIPTGDVSHCFPLNLNDKEPEVKGVENMLKTYRFALGKVGLNGPTNFSEIIETTTAMASAPLDQEHQHFSILLMLTDGDITDMDQTVDSIITASRYPIAIIIVGVGQADFTSMNRLDSDNQKLSHNGRTAEADIVQFVAFRDVDSSPSRLAKEVLAEIPAQFLSYMQAKKIHPNEPVYKSMQ